MKIEEMAKRWILWANSLRRDEKARSRFGVWGFVDNDYRIHAYPYRAFLTGYQLGRGEEVQGALLPDDIKLLQSETDIEPL